MDFVAHKSRILELLNAPIVDHSHSQSPTAAVDRSPKGCLDAPIVDLVHLINSIPDYVTTSSCSGRVVLYAQEERKWLYVVHEECTQTDVIKTCSNYFGNLATPNYNTTTTRATAAAAVKDEDKVILMKTEPFILHVLCKSVPAAQALLQVSRDAGFRESGISVGKKSIMCAVRTTGNSMEVPLTSSLATIDYLSFLVPYANDLFRKNKERIDIFQTTMVLQRLRKCMQLVLLYLS